MLVTRRWRAALTLTAVACGNTPPAEPPQLQSSTAHEIAGRNWVLVSIGDQPAGISARGEPVTGGDARTIAQSAGEIAGVPNETPPAAPVVKSGISD